MDSLNRSLEQFDRSPTAQALLVLALVFARYLVAEYFARRAERRAEKRRCKEAG